MGIFDVYITIINKFLDNFKKLFSKKQFKVLSLFPQINLSSKTLLIFLG